MTYWKAALLGLALSVSAAQAQELSDEARAAMETRVDDFGAAMSGGDMGAVFDFMPPQLLTFMATQAGIDEAALIEMSKAQIETAMATVTIDSFSMDTSAAKIEATPDGSVTYALIPTTTVMTVEGAGTMQATGDTLAFEEDGEWYLARVDDPGQAALLQSVYPAFAGVTFTPGTVAPVE
jgi:ketosteroid isomerase-like protein